RFDFDAATLLTLDGPLAVNRLPEGVDDAADDGVADRHVHDASGALDGVTLLDGARVAEDRAAHVVLLEVEHEAVHAPVRPTGEPDALARHGAAEAVNPGDAVAHRQHRPHFGHDGRAVDVLNLLLDDLGDLFGTELHSNVLGKGMAIRLGR